VTPFIQGQVKLLAVIRTCAAREVSQIENPDNKQITMLFEAQIVRCFVARKSGFINDLHPAGLEPAILVTKLKLAWVRFGGQRFGLILC
jgi:hypothetical protein